MGNQMCCQNTSSEVGSISISNGSLNQIKIEEFLAQNHTIKQVLLANQPQDTSQKKTRDRFLYSCNDYQLPEGTFFAKTISQDNVRNGYGIMLYKDQSYYEGQWKDDARQGEGIYCSEAGQYYKGEWKKDLAWGKGQYKSIDPAVTYSGDWLAGNKQGTGVEVYEDGSKYSGEFSEGEKDGFGKLTYSDGTYYEGQFKNNVIEGEGVFHGRNHRYEGGWQNGKMHGAGKSEWLDDDGNTVASYIGEYNNGIKEGFGEYTDSKGVTYKADWVNGEINERGPVITVKAMD